MTSLFKRKPSEPPLEWDPEHWDEIGEIAEPRVDHFAHRYAYGTEPATPEEYAAWLAGYVARGGKTRHRSRRRFPESEYRIAYRDVVVEPEYGAAAYTLIVPAGLKWRAPKGLGHITVCEMRDFKTTDPGVVEAFDDMRLI